MYGAELKHVSQEEVFKYIGTVDRVVLSMDGKEHWRFNFGILN